MSKQLINIYYNELHRDKQFGGTHNETSIRGAFIRLVNGYAERRHLLLVPEIYVKGKKGNNVRPDGCCSEASVRKMLQRRINGNTKPFSAHQGLKLCRPIHELPKSSFRFPDSCI